MRRILATLARRDAVRYLFQRNFRTLELSNFRTLKLSNFRTSLVICGLAATVAFAAQDAIEIRDRLQLADGLFRRNMYDLAAREYAALAATPGAPDVDAVLFRLGECYRHLKRFDEATRVYQRLGKEFPDSAQVLRANLQIALALLDAGGDSLPTAAGMFEKLVTADVAPEVRLAALYHLGETFERMKRSADALARYQQLRTEAPDSDYGMYAGLRTAYMLTQTGNADDHRNAMGIYLDLAHKSKDAKVAEEASYFAAQVALVSGRYEESASLFQSFHAKYPNSPRLAASALPAAWANLYSKRFKEASEAADLALASAQPPSSFEEALYVKANALNHLEQRADAVRFYTRLIESFPEGRYNASSQYERIMVLYRDGRYDEVLAASKQFVNPAPALADSLYWVNAESAMTLKKDDLAVQNCQLLVEKCPDSPFAKDALYRLGRVLQKQEAWEAASGWYLKVAERFPDDGLVPKALYSSGVCMSRLGQSEAALRDWTALLAKYPSDDLAAETLYQKAMEELRIKSHRAASATLDELLRRFPEDKRKPEILYWRAGIFRQLGETAEAEKTYLAALAATPPKEFEREIMLDLGVILLQTGRKPEAADYFRQLLDAPIAGKIGVDRLAWLAEFDCDNQRYDDAIHTANTLLTLPSADKGWKQTAWTIIGRARRKKNERDPAMQAFAEALATGAATVYGTEAALGLGEILTEMGKFSEAAARLNEAALRAAPQEQLRWRALAYSGLARNAEMKGDADAALRYYMSIGILFDDPVIVPESMSKAAALLDKLGRGGEATAMRDELKARYPNAQHVNPVVAPADGAGGKAAS